MTQPTAEKSKTTVSPVLWACLIFILSCSAALTVAGRAQEWLEANQIKPPQAGLQVPLIYFFSAVVVLGIVLFFIPVNKLRLVFRVIFVLLFAWGIFILLVLLLHIYTPVLLAAAVLLAIGSGVAWFALPRVWLHNLLLALALVSVGVSFGLALSPWTVLILLGVISIYDILAVTLGYMLWMAKKMSESDTLPTFILPKRTILWNMDLRSGGFRRLMETAAGEREFTILGGGDIGFPLVLVASVFYDYGLLSSAIVAAFALLGVVMAFLIQMIFLKNKPLPALPPISFASLVGFLIVYFVAV